MKKLVVVLVALVGAAPALAQEARPRFGVGVSIAPAAIGAAQANVTAAPTVEVYFPFLLTPQVRLEPSIGILTRNEPTPGTDTSDVTLGLGLFVVQHASQAADLYFGGRLKLNLASFDTPTASRSGTDLVLAAALGGEYFLASRFSAGVEAELGYYSNSDASLGGEASGLFTQGLAFMRFYF